MSDWPGPKVEKKRKKKKISWENHKESVFMDYSMQQTLLFIKLLKVLTKFGKIPVKQFAFDRKVVAFASKQKKKNQTVQN